MKRSTLIFTLVVAVVLSACHTRAEADDMQPPVAVSNDFFMVGGAAARDWPEMMRRFMAIRPEARLGTVNEWINGFSYRKDPADDPWDVPTELLARGAGDCEDFSLAKFFALRELGVAPGARQVRLGYVLLATPDGWRPHMVVLVSPSQEDQANPLVLDYPSSTMERLSTRQDIRVVFQFDELNIWGPGTERPSTDLSKWRKVLAQMDHVGDGRVTQAAARLRGIALPAPAALP